ncbi:hypothetical protein Dda_6422 [Drechslerella dactyloides]|uniref:Uncharacterized protein n=1 Tax=Drechslerella dactyloides TaxID=74499 RepID=A0AAD6NHI5_DREDA|nr:hypothetical protein Dda_6422 [Drechslerella dactyloides]
MATATNLAVVIHMIDDIASLENPAIPATSPLNDKISRMEGCRLLPANFGNIMFRDDMTQAYAYEGNERATSTLEYLKDSADWIMVDFYTMKSRKLAYALGPDGFLHFLKNTRKLPGCIPLAVTRYSYSISSVERSYDDIQSAEPYHASMDAHVLGSQLKSAIQRNR